MNLRKAGRPLSPSAVPLAGLLLATFAIGTDDFVIAGILPAISSDLSVSEAAAGQLVTAFSITYAVAAPIMAVSIARIPRRTLIAGGLSAFALVNFTTAFATAYPMLIVLRVLAALVASTVSPAAFAVAGRIVTSDRVGRAIGTVAAGLTASLVVGVPIGSGLSGMFGWRSTFAGVGILTCLAVAVIASALPRLPAMPVASVRARLVLLRRPAVLLCVAGTVIGACSGLMTYTYIAPITHALTGTAAYVPLFIAVMGISGAVGTVLGGRLTDRWGVDRTLMATFGGVLSATAGLAVAGLLTGGDSPVWVVCAFLALWGLAAWGNNPPMTSRVLRLAGDAGTEAVALNTSGLYAGIALAGAIGGGALGRGGGAGVLVAAAAAGVVTIVVMAGAVRRYPSRRTESTVKAPSVTP
jgi:predicted MFS family arabinose efflux permease